MKVSIFKPQCISEKGKRGKNEDWIYPNCSNAKESNRLFIVCDGLGGHVFGEIASRLACESFLDYIAFEENLLPENVLKFIEMRFSEYIEMLPECNGMGTTLSFLKFEKEFAYIGWVGDSRVYHVRNGKILLQTRDHSLINELIKKGELSVKEAKYDPRKNIITNVISGEYHPAYIEYKKIEDIKPDDYFLLCTDGFLENIDDNLIEVTLIKNYTVENIKAKFESICNNATSDNYSMVLIKIK